MNVAPRARRRESGDRRQSASGRSPTGLARPSCAPRRRRSVRATGCPPRRRRARARGRDRRTRSRRRVSSSTPPARELLAAHRMAAACDADPPCRRVSPRPRASNCCSEPGHGPHHDDRRVELRVDVVDQRERAACRLDVRALALVGFDRRSGSHRHSSSRLAVSRHQTQDTQLALRSREQDLKMREKL